MPAVKKPYLDGECEREKLASSSLSPLRCPWDPNPDQQPADQAGCAEQLESVGCHLQFIWFNVLFTSPPPFASLHTQITVSDLSSFSIRINYISVMKWESSLIIYLHVRSKAEPYHLRCQPCQLWLDKPGRVALGQRSATGPILTSPFLLLSIFRALLELDYYLALRFAVR